MLGGERVIGAHDAGPTDARHLARQPSVAGKRSHHIPAPVKVHDGSVRPRARSVQHLAGQPADAVRRDVHVIGDGERPRVETRAKLLRGSRLDGHRAPAQGSERLLELRAWGANPCSPGGAAHREADGALSRMPHTSSTVWSPENGSGASDGPLDSRAMSPCIRTPPTSTRLPRTTTCSLATTSVGASTAAAAASAASIFWRISASGRAPTQAAIAASTFSRLASRPGFVWNRGSSPTPIRSMIRSATPLLDPEIATHLPSPVRHTPRGTEKETPEPNRSSFLPSIAAAGMAGPMIASIGRSRSTSTTRGPLPRRASNVEAKATSAVTSSVTATGGSSGGASFSPLR